MAGLPVGARRFWDGGTNSGFGSVGHVATIAMPGTMWMRGTSRCVTNVTETESQVECLDCLDTLESLSSLGSLEHQFEYFGKIGLFGSFG